MNIQRFLRQKALYWANPVPDGFGGVTLDLPLVLSVRWEDRHEDFIDSEGIHTVSNSIVYVSQDVVTGGYIHLLSKGEGLDLWILSDYGTKQLTTSIAAEYIDPFSSAISAQRIRQFGKVPDLKGNKHLRRVWL